MPDRIYLDQNKWIKLFKQKEDKISDPDTANVLKDIREQSSEGSAVFPLSLYHMKETATSHNRNGRRDRLFEFMYDLSDFHVIAPMNIVYREEIPHFIEKRIEQTPDMTEKVFGKGAVFLLGGGNWDIFPTSNLPQGDKQVIKSKIEQASETKWAFDLITEDSDFIDALRDREHEEGLVSFLEENIKQEDERFDDNKYRRRRNIVRFFIDYIAPSLIEICNSKEIDEGLVTTDLGAYVNQQDEELASEAEAFLKEFPSTYSYLNLSITRDIQAQPGTVDSNDLNDLMSLGVAIPYCDVVVTENMWKDIAKRYNLHEIYDTKITADLTDLKEYV